MARPARARRITTARSTRAELPLAAGQSAKFRIATNATWSTAGTANGDGSRTWDLSGQLSGDADSTVALASPTGAWWAADFTARDVRDAAVELVESARRVRGQRDAA